MAASAGRQSGYFSTRDQVEKLLYDVVKHYETGGIDRPSRSPLLQPLTPTEQERIDLVAFLPRRSAA